MKELFQRNTKLQNLKVCQDGDELVIFYTDNKFSKVGKTTAYRLPAKYIYCLECYQMPFYILKEVKRLLQIEKDSNIPPTVNTDSENESSVIAVSAGAVPSVGDALSQQFKQALAHCSTCLDLPSFMRCKDACSLSKDDPQVSPFIDDDIPDFGLGV